MPFVLPPSTTRDSRPERQTENVLYLVLEDLVLHIICELQRRLPEFRYSGPLEFGSNAEGDDFTCEDIRNARITKEREVIIAESNGTCRREIRNCCIDSTVLGGGAMFLLDKYVHQFVTDGSIPPLYTVSGLTSDLDVDFNVMIVREDGKEEPGAVYTNDEGSVESRTDRNKPFHDAIMEFAANVIRETCATETFQTALTAKREFLSGFLTLAKHNATFAEDPRAVVVNLDGGAGYFYMLLWPREGDDELRINLNIDYDFEGHQHQHLADIFFHFPEAKWPAQDARNVFMNIRGKMVPFHFNRTVDQLNDMTDRYIRAWEFPNNGKQSEIPFRRCSNDRRRFLWFLRTLGHPAFPIELLKNPTAHLYGFVGALALKYNYQGFLKQFVTQKKIDLRTMSDEVILTALRGADPAKPKTYAIIKDPQFGDRKLFLSVELIRVLRVMMRIVDVIDAHSAIRRADVNQKQEALAIAHDLEACFNQLEHDFPGTPCMISETPEAAAMIVRTYEEIIQHVTPQTWTHASLFGRRFAKTAARRIRSIM